MIDFEVIKQYLPQYLSAESQDVLFKDLKKFPDNIDQKFYSHVILELESYHQGDGVSELLVIDFPNTHTGKLPSIILSNSCDINPLNTRVFPSRVVYAPIFQLEKYKQALVKDHVETGNYSIEAIENHIVNVKKQLNSQILFLPQGQGLDNDSLVFLDRINNCPISQLSQENNTTKLFSLSNYGFYIFLIKLSIHFTRVQEGVDRFYDSP